MNEKEEAYITGLKTGANHGFVFGRYTKKTREEFLKDVDKMIEEVEAGK